MSHLQMMKNHCRDEKDIVCSEVCHHLNMNKNDFLLEEESSAYFERSCTSSSRRMHSSEKTVWVWGGNGQKSWDRVTPSRSPRARCVTQNSGEKVSVAGNHSIVRTSGEKSVESKFRGRNARRNPETDSVRPQRRMGLDKGCLSTQKRRQRYVLLSCRSLANAGTIFEKARRATVRNRLRSVHAHAEQEGNSSKIHEHHNGGNGQWRSAEKRSNILCARSSVLRDCAVAQRHW